MFAFSPQTENRCFDVRSCSNAPLPRRKAQNKRRFDMQTSTISYTILSACCGLSLGPQALYRPSFLQSPRRWLVDFDGFEGLYKPNTAQFNNETSSSYHIQFIRTHWTSARAARPSETADFGNVEKVDCRERSPRHQMRTECPQIQ